jgi:hypothetical protein
MSTNTQNLYPLVAGQVPNDRECVSNLSEILAGVQDFVQVSGVSATTGTSLPTQDSVGQQALSLAQSLQNQLSALVNSNPVIRTSPGWLAIPTGTAAVEFPINWSSALPSNNYQLSYCVQGPPGSTSALSGTFDIYIVNGSATPTSCTLHIDKPPAASAGWTFQWTIQCLPSSAGAVSTLINGFSPTGGAAGITSVSISGSGFTGCTEVDFNGTAATTFEVVTDTLITAQVPVGATAGVINVVVGGQLYYSSNSFGPIV